MQSKGWINESEFPLFDGGMALFGQKAVVAITENNVHPIPITKELIEKVFSKVKDGIYEYKPKIDKWISERFVVKILDDPNNENWATYETISGDHVGVFTSFHQLQNLYYLITGRELLGPYTLVEKLNDKWVLRYLDKL